MVFALLAENRTFLLRQRPAFGCLCRSAQTQPSQTQAEFRCVSCGHLAQVRPSKDTTASLAAGRTIPRDSSPPGSYTALHLKADPPARDCAAGAIVRRHAAGRRKTTERRCFRAETLACPLPREGRCAKNRNVSRLPSSAAADFPENRQERHDEERPMQIGGCCKALGTPQMGQWQYSEDP
jgi:hypothetical protein